MNSDQIDRQLVAVFRAVFGIQGHAASVEMNREQIAEWDSLTHVTLILSIESTFDVQFSSSELDGLTSFDAFKQRLVELAAEK